MATPLPLEGDGLVENLFYFLWCKDDFGAGPRIFVPHTVLFRSAQPAAWYFTSLRSNKIKKKAKVNLTNTQIEHEFTKKRGASDIVACYLYFASNTSSSNPESSSTVIEYFDAEALRDFLYHRDKSSGGMLQKFMLPKGTNNATVRAIWSPKICLLERRVNLRNVHDKRYSVYERGVTFDGADLHSRPEPVRGAMLPGEVQLLCEQVVDHVTQVTYHKYRIARMVLHLKTDADDRLWLLWCSSLRLLNLNASDSGALRPLDIVNDAQVPEFARLPFGQSNVASITAGLGPSGRAGLASSHQHHHRDQDETHLGFARCMSCGQLKEQKKLLATNYKAVLDHFQRFMRFLRLQMSEGEHATIEWPPDQRFVQAAGGVGFGILECFEKGSFSSGGSSAMKKATQATSGGGGGSANSLTRKELVIPPVIQYLHPNFSVDDFERHRHDPIFLHKPVAVCESCCLVYSDYTTLSLEVNSIGQTAPAILRPHCELSDAKKRLDPLDPLAVALTTNHSSLHSPVPGARSLKKPPASAWKPVEESKKPPRARGPQTGLSSLPSAPQLPQRIDSFSELQEFAGSGGSALGSSQSANALLQQREETFFRELHQQKDLERGHPLHHMLESATRLAASKRQRQQKLAMRLSNTEGNSIEGFGRSRSVGMLPELLEQQLASKKMSSKSPYSVVLRLRESIPETDECAGLTGDQQVNEGSPAKLASSTLKKKAKKRAGGKKKKKSSKEEKGGESEDEKQSNIGANAAARFVSSREKKASEEHQDFLFAALSQAEAQLENIESLASLLPEIDHIAAGNRGYESESDGVDDGGSEDEGHDGEMESENVNLAHGEIGGKHNDELDQDSDNQLDDMRVAGEGDHKSEGDNECIECQPNRDSDGAEQKDDADLDSDKNLDNAASAIENDNECEVEVDSACDRGEDEQNKDFDQQDSGDHLDADSTHHEDEGEEGVTREQNQGDSALDGSNEQRDTEDQLASETGLAGEDDHDNELLRDQADYQDEAEHEVDEDGHDDELLRDQEEHQDEAEGEELGKDSVEPLENEAPNSEVPTTLGNECESDAQ